MRKYRFFSNSFKPHRFLLSTLISIVLTYFLRESVFSYIFSGKSLSARNLSIQILFTFFLICLLFTALYFAFGKIIDWLIKNIAVSAALLSLVPLTAYATMGSYSRFVADDFSSASLAVHKGILGATWDWYINWSGRFSASFFDSLIGYLGPGALRFTTGLVIVLWCVGLISLVFNLFQSRNKITRIAVSTLISALILTATFEITPLLSQSLYWGQGMRSVILPLAAGVFLVLLLFSLLKKKRSHPLQLISVAGLSFIAGGFGETYVVLQTTALLLAFFLLYIFQQAVFVKNCLPVILSALTGSFLAMGVIILAPGNSVRQGYFPPPPDIFNLFRISIVAFGNFITNLFSSLYKIEILLVLFIASILAGISTSGRRVMNLDNLRFFKFPENRNLSFFIAFLLTLVISLLLLFSCFVPSAYGMSTSPQDRTLVIPTFVFTLSLANLGVILGSHFSQSLRNFIARYFSDNGLRITAWVAILLFCGFIAQVTSNILLLQPEYRRFALVFDTADKTIHQAKSAGKISVEVPEVHNHFGLSDYGAGTTYWLDEAVNSYYGVDVIVNKNIKVK